MTRPYPPRRSKAAFTDDELRAVAATVPPAESASAWFTQLTARLNALKPACHLTVCAVQNRCSRAQPPIRTCYGYFAGEAA